MAPVPTCMTLERGACSGIKGLGLGPYKGWFIGGVCIQFVRKA